MLIVDDHRIVAEGIAELLGAQYTVLPIVTDGTLVPALVVKERPDILLTDITMPNVSGLEAYRQIRRQGLDIPTVILTMHAQAAMVDEALSIGIRGYVLKTAAGEELLLAMKEVLRGGTFVSPSLWPRTAEKPRP
ncbi:MAG TPA: response regulator transcription factor, partial [Afipia sp.]